MSETKKLIKKTRILAINFGGIGDEILFFPTLKTYKEAYPNSHLTLVTEPRSQGAKTLTKLIDKVVPCDIKGKFKYWNIFKLLIFIWSKKYEVVISSGSSKFVSILLFLTGIKKRIGYDSGLLSKILLSETVKLNKDQYAAAMYHDLVKTLGESKMSLPQVDILPENLVWADAIIGSREKKIIAIHPGVSRLSVQKKMIKFWSAENWVSLILKLSEKYKVVLVGGPDDENTFLQIRAELATHDYPEENLFNLYGQTRNISQLASIIDLSDILVCVDSAPMHVAIGTRTQTVAIFGPTDENKLIPPNDPRFVAIKNENLKCRPCLWEKRQTTCDSLDCLNIEPETVFEAIENLLK